MKRYALLGDKLSHSLSPAIHRRFFCAFACNAVYDLLPAAPEDLPRAVQTLLAGYDGFNVTKPYKESILPYLDNLEGAAAVARSVNTVKIAGGKAAGYSTDGAGFLRSLAKEGVDPAGKRILLLGAGGAAKAVAAALSLGYRCAVDCYAPLSSARALPPSVRPVARVEGGGYDIVVNCTPVGQTPDTAASPLTQAELSGAGFVFDAVYNPARTLLLSYAAQAGIPHVGGLDMLIFQAYEAQRVWLGRDLTESALCDTIEGIKGELQ